MSEYKIVLPQWRLDFNGTWYFSNNALDCKAEIVKVIPYWSDFPRGYDLQIFDYYARFPEDTPIESIKKFALDYYVARCRSIIESLREPLTIEEESELFKRALSNHTTEESIELWLETPNPALCGIAPATLMSLGAFGPLWKMLSRLDGDVSN